MNSFWNNTYINRWNLFWATSVPMSLIMIYVMTQHDMSTGGGVSEMIGFAVRWAVPLIYIVTAASAVPVLFPSNFTQWWFRNRKFIGLTFAVAMAWQGTFIYIMSTLPEFGDGKSLNLFFYLIVLFVISTATYSSTKIKYVKILSMTSSSLFFLLIIGMWVASLMGL